MTKQGFILYVKKIIPNFIYLITKFAGMKLLLIILTMGLIIKMNSSKDIEILYNLSMKNPSSHYFEVGINFKGLDKSKIDLVLPVWRPGRYLIFDFASGVRDFNAVDSKGKKLIWKKTDKTTWQINTESVNEVNITYLVYAEEFQSRTRGLDTTHGFVNGTAVFMFCPDYRSHPIELKVEKYENWHVTTGLQTVDNDPYRFSAPNYDYFSDCPLEIGTQKDFDFEVDGRKHVISFYGNAGYLEKKLIDDFTRIIKKNYEFWGKVPYDRYVFIVHCTPESSGGTEHINSTVVGVKPAAFETEEGYKSFLRLISHEFFHTWNVKQLKPAGLTPFNFTKENYTSELWIAEGGTSYYDGLMLLRTGQMNLDDFYKEITKGIDDERRRPGYRVQSVAESSFDAWVKFWRRTPDAFSSESDYYLKGSYVCLILDLEIRNSSNGKHSLDDVFKAMFERYPLDVKGYTNENFRSVCEEFAAKELKEFFGDYVTGTKPIEWEKFLGYAGLELNRNDTAIVPVVGIVTSKKGDRIIIDEVLTGSSGEKAGLIAGDEIIAFNGLRLPYEDMEKSIKELKTGDKVKLTSFRNDRILEFTLELKERKLSDYSISQKKNPTNLQKEILTDWLEISGWE
jgi:predicted metalloprotease with PDZ domain